MPGDHGTTPASWWGRGAWPRCKCGYDPHDNTALAAHYRELGFVEYEDHGQIKRRSA